MNHIRLSLLNLLPNINIFDWSKLKAFACDKTNINEKLKFNLGMVGNIVGKGENAYYQYFVLFLQFLKGFFFKVIIILDCVVKRKSAFIQDDLKILLLDKRLFYVSAVQVF